MKSSLRSLIPFMSFLLNSANCKFRRLDSIQSLLPSSYPGRLASRNSTDLNDLPCPYKPSARIAAQKIQPLSCCEHSFKRKRVYWAIVRNGLHNPVVVLLRAYILRMLHNNSCCLQSHLLATGPYATIWLVNTGLERMWKMLIMVQFEELFWNMPTETEENHESTSLG
jgi:hypothetical protein